MYFAAPSAIQNWLSFKLFNHGGIVIAKFHYLAFRSSKVISCESVSSACLAPKKVCAAMAADTDRAEESDVTVNEYSSAVSNVSSRLGSTILMRTWKDQ
jgi:hypothetical protein